MERRISYSNFHDSVVGFLQPIEPFRQEFREGIRLYNGRPTVEWAGLRFGCHMREGTISQLSVFQR